MRAAADRSSSRASAGCSCRSADGGTCARSPSRSACRVVVAARPGLGTINHTLLTLEAARAAGLDVRAVVLTPWPDAPGAIERSNRATLDERAGVPVHALRAIAPVTRTAMAAAAADLPVEDWL